ncbi:hypothetical protein BH24ACT4_BH24ACT4_09830 [soil metagenome]
MTSPFDPRSWLPRSAGGPDPRSVVDAWADMTSWWLQPASTLAGTLAHPSEQMLAQMVSGLMTTFGGQRMDLRVRGHRVSGSLESVVLVPRNLRGDLSA